MTRIGLILGLRSQTSNYHLKQLPIKSAKSADELQDNSHNSIIVMFLVEVRDTELPLCPK